MASAWAKLNPNDIPGKAGFNANYSCRDVPKKKFHLSEGAKIGIAIGIGLPALAAFLWFVNWASQKEEAKRKAAEANKPGQPPPAYHMANLDRVPEYAPHNKEESVPEGGVDASHVGETPLPPEYAPPNGEESVPEGGGNGSAVQETPLPPEYEGHGTTGETAEVRRGDEEDARTDQNAGS